MLVRIVKVVFALVISLGTEGWRMVAGKDRAMLIVESFALLEDHIASHKLVEMGPFASLLNMQVGVVRQDSRWYCGGQYKGWTP